ncbi:MAG: hypothetical protein DRJ47_09190 [Thermoprotei archaeon]|nr:MAG: hypothetical protein DRJ47_09190 [Thermoprotei archaeon]
MSENRYEECINLIKLYKGDIIQKALKKVITNKMKKRIEELDIDGETVLDEPKSITLRYEIEIDREFVVIAYDVFEQIIELLEKRGSEDNEKDVEVYDECNPYK